MKGKVLLTTIGLALVLATIFFFWPMSLNKPKHPIHPELVGNLFEGQKISEQAYPTRELVSREIHSNVEEVQEFEDCAGMSNLAAGSIVMGGTHYSFLSGCCLVSGNDLTIHAGKLNQIHLVVKNLSTDDFQSLGNNTNQNFPIANLSLQQGSTSVELQKCKTQAHNFDSSEKGLALSCEATTGNVRVKFRCEDFKSLGSGAYF